MFELYYICIWYIENFDYLNPNCLDILIEIANDEYERKFEDASRNKKTLVCYVFITLLVRMILVILAVVVTILLFWNSFVGYIWQILIGIVLWLAFLFVSWFIISVICHGKWKHSKNAILRSLDLYSEFRLPDPAWKHYVFISNEGIKTATLMTKKKD